MLEIVYARADGGPYKRPHSARASDTGIRDSPMVAVFSAPPAVVRGHSHADAFPWFPNVLLTIYVDQFGTEGRRERPLPPNHVKDLSFPIEIARARGSRGCPASRKNSRTSESASPSDPVHWPMGSLGSRSEGELHSSEHTQDRAIARTISDRTSY
jgi:hypothetical protein